MTAPTPVELERAANHAATLGHDAFDYAAFLGALYSIDVTQPAPDRIVTADVQLLRSASGWYSQPLTADPSLLSVGSAWIERAR